MSKYIKKPVIIEAVQYIRGQEVPAVEFLGGYDREKHEVRIGEYETDVAIFTLDWYDQGCSIIIKTLEGELKVSDGDYIIKGIKGEFYPCKPDIFEETYEPYPEDGDEN